MKRYKLALAGFISLLAILAIYVLLHRHQIAVFNPRGTIALEQRNLIVFTLLLSLIVVLPVFVMLFGFAWRYRADNKQAKYKPNQDHNLALETIWWLIPLMLISVLAVVTWRSSHSLDPFRPIASEAKPLKVQVVALEWRWLFIYPNYGVASLNYLQIPEDTPVDLEITSDAPMNSLWIPQLAGQVYAMSGMSTELHIMADQVGDYRGSSANISGEGFSGMNFNAHVSTFADFEDWTDAIKRYGKPMGASEYVKLARPSKDHTARTYHLSDNQLYDQVIAKYMPSHHGVDQ